MRTLRSRLHAWVQRLRGPHRSRAVRSTAALCALTAQLPPDTRRVVTLYKVYELRPGEIAVRLGFTPAQVEQHLVTAALVFSGACGRHFAGASCIDSSESTAEDAAGGATT